MRQEDTPEDSDDSKSSSSSVDDCAHDLSSEEDDEAVVDNELDNLSENETDEAVAPKQPRSVGPIVGELAGTEVVVDFMRKHFGAPSRPHRQCKQQSGNNPEEAAAQEHGHTAGEQAQQQDHHPVHDSEDVEEGELGDDEAGAVHYDEDWAEDDQEADTSLNTGPSHERKMHVCEVCLETFNSNYGLVCHWKKFSNKEGHEYVHVKDSPDKCSQARQYTDPRKFMDAKARDEGHPLPPTFPGKGLEHLWSVLPSQYPDKQVITPKCVWGSNSDSRWDVFHNPALGPRCERPPRKAYVSKHRQQPIDRQARQRQDSALSDNDEDSDHIATTQQDELWQEQLLEKMQQTLAEGEGGDRSMQEWKSMFATSGFMQLLKYRHGPLCLRLVNGDYVMQAINVWTPASPSCTLQCAHGDVLLCPGLVS